MKRYKINIAALFLGAALFTACSDGIDTYGDIDGSDFSSYKWYTSDLNNSSSHNINDKDIRIDSYVSFYDVSQGIVSRTWTIPESAQFLNNEFEEGDTLSYEKFIIKDAGKTSKNELINVLFTEKGMQEVVLKSVFKNEVEGAVNVDGKWTVEETFTVDVYEHLNPQAEVFTQNFDADGEVIADTPYVSELVLRADQDPQASEIETWKEIIIEAGENIRFEDQSTIGRPTNANWITVGGKPETSSGEASVVTYNKLGQFTASMQSVRRNLVVDGETDVRPQQTIDKLIPLRITVIKSSRPFVKGGDVDISTEDNTLSFAVTGEIDEASISGQESKFVVNVKNDLFDQNIAVESLTVDSSDATILILKLAEPIYDNDVINVSYTDANLNDTDGIMSVDERALVGFEETDLTLPISKLTGVMNTDYTGYEFPHNDSGGNRFKLGNLEKGLFWVPINSNQESGFHYFFRSEEKAYRGDSSVKFSTPATGIPQNNVSLMQGGGFKSKSPLLTAGVYIPSVWVYVESATTMTKFTYRFTSGGPEATFNFDVTGITKDKWVQLSLPPVTLEPITGGRFDLVITHVGQDDAVEQIMWFDNFDLLTYNVRP